MARKIGGEVNALTFTRQLHRYSWFHSSLQISSLPDPKSFKALVALIAGLVPNKLLEMALNIFRSIQQPSLSSQPPLISLPLNPTLTFPPARYLPLSLPSPHRPTHRHGQRHGQPHLCR